MLLEAGADPRRTYEGTSILEYTARAALRALEFHEYEKLDTAEQCLAVLSKAYPQDGPEKKRSRERVQEEIDTATQKLHETEKRIRADRYKDDEQRRDDLSLREFFSKKISRLNHLFNIF